MVADRVFERGHQRHDKDVVVSSAHHGLLLLYSIHGPLVEGVPSTLRLKTDLTPQRAAVLEVAHQAHLRRAAEAKDRPARSLRE